MNSTTEIGSKYSKIVENIWNYLKYVLLNDWNAQK